MSVPEDIMEQSMLDESRNNYICSMYSSDKNIGICFCDISTGELYATDISGRDYYRILTNQLSSYSPREILFGGDILNLKQLPEFIKSKLSAGVEMLDDDKFELSLCRETVEQQFPVHIVINIFAENDFSIRDMMFPEAYQKRK